MADKIPICPNKKCKSSLEMAQIRTEFAAHSAQYIDILITCPKCQHTFNDFVSLDDMVDLND